MTPELSRRVARAMNAGKPEPEERARVVDAVQGVASFDDLPLPIKRLIRRWEKNTGA